MSPLNWPDPRKFSGLLERLGSCFRQALVDRAYGDKFTKLAEEIYKRIQDGRCRPGFMIKRFLLISPKSRGSDIAVQRIRQKLEKVRRVWFQQGEWIRWERFALGHSGRWTRVPRVPTVAGRTSSRNNANANRPVRTTGTAGRRLNFNETENEPPRPRLCIHGGYSGAEWPRGVNATQVTVNNHQNEFDAGFVEAVLQRVNVDREVNRQITDLDLD